MNDFDQAARYAAKIDPPVFLAWVFPGVRPELVLRGWMDTRTLPAPGEPDRTCDTVADFEDTAHPGERWAAVVEFQSTPLRGMLLRVLEYESRLLRELNSGPEGSPVYHVVAALLNLTGPQQPETLEIHLPGRPNVGLWLGVEGRTMREEDAATTLAAIAAGQFGRCILPWIPLRRSASEASIIDEWKQLASQEPDAGRRAAYGGLALVFADLANRREEWEKALETWNMNESNVVAQWRAEGREQGTLTTKRQDLLEVLRLRFPVQLPADTRAAVETMTDLDELSRWFKVAVTAPSLDAFRAAVQPQPVSS